MNLCSIVPLSLALFLVHMSSMAQDLKPIANEDVEKSYSQDRLNRTLVAWTEVEVTEFRIECEAQLMGKVNDPKAFCSCAQPLVAANLNFLSFDGRSDYQKGKTLGFLTQGLCAR